MQDINITIVCDNNPYKEGLETGWGFSCLINGAEKTILFDTGPVGSLLVNMEKLAIEPQSIDTVVLSHIHPDHTSGLGSFLKKNPDVAVYQNHFFDRHDLVDKASTIGKVEQGSVYCNFYRVGRSGPYSAKDWQLLEVILPLVTTLISTHYRILQLTPTDEKGRFRNARSLVHNIISKNVSPFSQLTPREREVCERILLGYTSVGIGLDLNIAQSSVVTYRRRAYEKLGISTQNELFTLCLTASQYVAKERHSS